MKQILKFAKGLDPVADAFDSTQYSDVFNMKNYKKIRFVIYKGVGTTGTSTITVEACDDTTPSNTSAVEFMYQAITSGDTPGAIAYATTSGFTTTAGSSQLYIVSVDAAALNSSGYGYVRLKMVESVNSPVVGAVLAILSESRDEREIPASAIV